MRRLITSGFLMIVLSGMSAPVLAGDYVYTS